MPTPPNVLDWVFKILTKIISDIEGEKSQTAKKSQNPTKWLKIHEYVSDILLFP